MADMTFKAKLLPFADLNDSYTLGSSSKRWKIFGDLTGNAATATALSTSGTAAKFWRGDNTWSDTISGGTLKITANSNTVTIGSQNANFCHIYNSANIPFIFNNTVETTTGGLGTTSYPWNDMYVNLSDGTSDFTDNTELLTSYASNNGFADTNAKYKVYKRDAICMYNYIKTKASGTWGISISGNAATATKANGLVDGTSTMTSAYNKAGLAYADYTWLAGWNGYELRAVNKSQFAQASHTHSYLPLSGGTMTGWITFDAEQGIYARIKRKKADGGGWAYSPISMIGNDNAAFAAIGVYGSANTMTYMYIGANAYNGNNLYIYPDGHIWATKVYGAVWNDYAEYRKDNLNEIQKPGRCVRELGNGVLALTTKRLERGCEIVSDTFGFAIGKDEDNGYNTPIASNGRVLAYPYESIEEFADHIGWPVCSGPNGTVSIMTEEEEEKYPSRIIGTISEIPTYEEWGTGNVKVNGRVWIRIK